MLGSLMERKSNMAGLWSSILLVASSSLVTLLLKLVSPRILATIIVLSAEKFVKKSTWECDDKLLNRIKEEWNV